MAFNLGSMTQYDDANSIADPAVAILAKAINMPKEKGAFWQRLMAPEAAMALDTVDFEIYNRTKTTRLGIIGDGVGGGWDDDDTTGLDITTGLAGLTVGLVLKVEDEYIVIKEVTTRTSAEAGIISVWARGAGGTTAAAHADTTAYTVVGSAINDTDLKNIESMTELTGKYLNYIQLQAETIDTTQRVVQLRRKGVPADRITAIIEEEALIRWIENAANSVINGLKQSGAKGSSPYMTAGLLAQLDDTAGGNRPVLKFNMSGGFTEIGLVSACDDVFAVGNPDTIYCSRANKKLFNGFNKTDSNIAVNTSVDDRSAGSYISMYNYEGNILNIVVDADMPDDKIAIVTQANCVLEPVIGDQLRFEDEPQLSSREQRRSVQGSWGLSVEGVGYDHTFIYGITA